MVDNHGFRTLHGRDQYFMPDQEPISLIVRYLSNEATSEEQGRLLEWVSADAENQRVFHEYARTWNKEEISSDWINRHKALQRLNATIDAWDQEKDNGPTSFPWIRVAAAFAFFILTGLGVFYYSFHSPASDYLAYTTDAGQRATVYLPDGSKVRLNSASTLKYPAKFEGNTREVFLEGEGFFEVSRDETKPFIVHTGDLYTQVLGTSFNIDAAGASVEVAVATGKVKVSDGDRMEFLLPSDKIRYEINSHHISRSRIDLTREMAWVNNTIIFEDTDLFTASRTLSEWFNVSIIIKNPLVKNCTITGTYTNESLHHILEAIEFSAGVQTVVNDSQILIDGEGCDKK